MDDFVFSCAKWVWWHLFYLTARLNRSFQNCNNCFYMHKNLSLRAAKYTQIQTASVCFCLSTLNPYHAGWGDLWHKNLYHTDCIWTVLHHYIFFYIFDIHLNMKSLYHIAYIHRVSLPYVLICFKITVLWKWFIIPIIFLGIVSSNIFFLSGDRKHFTILNNFIVFLSSMNGFKSLPHGLYSLLLSRMCSFIPRRPYYSMGLPHWLHSQQYIFFNVFRENCVVKRLCHFYYTCGTSLLYLFFSTLRDNSVMQKAHFFCLYGFSSV